MNKKSNLTRTALLAALLCGIAGPTFVGCKDYDDDINALQEQIDANKDAIAKLQELVNGGAIVKSVVSDNDGGIIITLSDGTEHHITKGDKGEQGEQGLQGEQGIQGLPGAEGKTPIFWFNEENGHLLYAYDSNTPKEEWKDLGKITADVEEPTEPQKPSYEFTVNEDGFLCVDGVATSVRIEGRMYLVEEEGVIWLHMPKMVDGKLDYSYKIALPTSELFLRTVSSVNFVPSSLNGKDLAIYSVPVWDVKTNTATKEVVRATPSVLRFRVSPSTAKLYDETTEKGDYKVVESMDYNKLTRATAPLFTAKNAEVKEDGYLYVNFGFDAENLGEDNYTLALQLEDLHNVGRRVYSDYITFQAAGTGILNDDIQFYQEVNEKMELVKLGEQKLEWAKDASLDLSSWFAGVEIGDKFDEALADKGFAVEYNLTYNAKKGEEGYVTVDNEKKIITLADNSYQTKDAKLEFYFDVMANGQLVARREVTVTVKEVNKEQEFAGLYTVLEADQAKLVNFIGNLTMIKMEANRSVMNEIETFFDCDIETVTDFEFTVEKDGKAYTETAITFDGEIVTIPASTKAGKYVISAIWTYGKKVATTSFELDLVAPKLVPVAQYWKDGNLIVVANDEGELISDLNAVFQKVDKAEVVFTSKDTKGYISIDPLTKKLSLTDDGKKALEMNSTLEIAMTYQLMNGSYAVTEPIVCKVVFYNPIESATMEDGLSMKVDEKIDVLGLNFLVKAEGNTVLSVKEEKGTYSLVLDESNVYGIQKPTYEVKEGQEFGKESLNIDENGFVTWIGNQNIVDPVEVTVVVTIVNKWAPITKEVKITVNPKVEL